jgi:hypothetical protein
VCEREREIVSPSHLKSHNKVKVVVVGGFKKVSQRNIYT